MPPPSCPRSFRSQGGGDVSRRCFCCGVSEHPRASQELGLILGTSLPSEVSAFHQPPNGSATEKVPEPVSSIPPPFSLCTPESHPPCQRPLKTLITPAQNHSGTPTTFSSKAKCAACLGGPRRRLLLLSRYVPSTARCSWKAKGLRPQGICSSCPPAWCPCSVPRIQPQYQSSEAFLDASPFASPSSGSSKPRGDPRKPVAILDKLLCLRGCLDSASLVAGYAAS